MNCSLFKDRAEKKYNEMSMEDLIRICAGYGMKNDLDRTTMVAHLTKIEVYKELYGHHGPSHQERGDFYEDNAISKNNF